MWLCSTIMMRICSVGAITHFISLKLCWILFIPSIGFIINGSLPLSPFLPPPPIPPFSGLCLGYAKISTLSSVFSFLRVVPSKLFVYQGLVACFWNHFICISFTLHHASTILTGMHLFFPCRCTHPSPHPISFTSNISSILVLAHVSAP